LIQRTWHLNSIVAHKLLVAEFFDSIGQKQTSRHIRVMSNIPLKADIHQRGLRVRFVHEETFAISASGLFSPASLQSRKWRISLYFPV